MREARRSGFYLMSKKITHASMTKHPQRRAYGGIRSPSYILCQQCRKPHPVIVLSGQWLYEIAFFIGCIINISCSQGELWLRLLKSQTKQPYRSGCKGKDGNGGAVIDVLRQAQKSIRFWVLVYLSGTAWRSPECGTSIFFFIHYSYRNGTTSVFTGRRAV